MRKIDKDLKLVIWTVLLFIAIGLVFVWFATPADATLKLSQTWEWQSVPNATSYRLYWSATGKAWCSFDSSEIPASACVLGRCQGDVALPSYSVFVAVTSVNSAGLESLTEHGPVISCY